MTEHLNKAKQKQKEFFDRNKNAKEHEIKVGDLVMIYKTFIKKHHKFKTHWQGPFRVMALRRPDVIVKEIKGGKEKLIKIHLNKVKKFNEPYTLPLRQADEPTVFKRIFLDKNLEESEEESDDENRYECFEQGDKECQAKEARTPKRIFLDKNIEESDDE